MGCIPTKTQVGSAKAIQMARRGEEFGFRIAGLDVDWPRIRARKDAVVSSVVRGIERSLGQNPRIDLLSGSARFLGAGRLAVGEREIEAERIIVASGVVPVVPAILGLADAGFETNETVMDLPELPRSMVVIGGGPEGADLLPQGILLLHTAERTIAPLTDCICVHPTFSEGVKAAVGNLKSVEAVATATGNVEGQG